MITYENMQKRMEEINKELEHIRRLEKRLPDGELRCTKNEKRYKWKIRKEDGLLHYLPKTERNLAEALALKKYIECRKIELESELAGWNAYLRKISKIKVPSEQLLNHPEYGKLLDKNFKPLDQELRKWQEDSYERCRNHMENLIVPGTQGKMLRSKSEAIIDKILYQNKIPFRYEEKIILNGNVLHPDFTIRHPKNGKYFYWEHFGLMDNPDYVNNSCQKIKIYCDNGIIPTINLILTYETKDHPLSIDQVEKIVREYF